MIALADPATYALIGVLAAALIQQLVPALNSRRTKRSDADAQHEKQSQTAIDGYDKLVADLWKEMDKREKRAQAEIKSALDSAERECRKRIEDAIDEINERVATLAAKHDQLDKEVGNGKHTIGP